MTKYKTIWLSDIHLGTKGCQAEYLLDFLKNNSAETIYLVGDIIDGWRIMGRSKTYWPTSHNTVVQKLLKMARAGTEIIFVTGNHDEFLRPLVASHDGEIKFGNMSIVNSHEYTSIKNYKFWIVHGDAFDGITSYHKWAAILGDNAYNFLLFTNMHLNNIRRFLKLPYWSISKYLKQKTKSAVNFIFKFEDKITKETKRRGYDGVICGHIHHPEIKKLNEVTYINCGDWVENCSAVVEDLEGNINVVRWTPDTISN